MQGDKPYASHSTNGNPTPGLELLLCATLTRDGSTNQFVDASLGIYCWLIVSWNVLRQIGIKYITSMTGSSMTYHANPLTRSGACLRDETFCIFRQLLLKWFFFQDQQVQIYWLLIFTLVVQGHFVRCPFLILILRSIVPVSSWPLNL